MSLNLGEAWERASRDHLHFHRPPLEWRFFVLAVMR